MATYELTIPDHAFHFIDAVTFLRSLPADVQLASTLAGELLGLVSHELDRQGLPKSFTRAGPSRALYSAKDILEWGLKTGRLVDPSPAT
jgi:hypothetical protein